MANDVIFMVYLLLEDLGSKFIIVVAMVGVTPHSVIRPESEIVACVGLPPELRK